MVRPYGQQRESTLQCFKKSTICTSLIDATDTGCGICLADLEHIFDPFYTTKHESQERERTGLARFHSLTRKELALLLFASGAVQISVHSAFDDQAYLAVAEKPLR